MGARYPLDRWRDALDHALSAGRLGTGRVVFELPNEQHRKDPLVTRPGFVLEVDERTPPLLVHSGESLRLERFPLGTRVIYPPEIAARPRRPGRGDRGGADAPIDSPPLRELLRPGCS